MTNTITAASARVQATLLATNAVRQRSEEGGTAVARAELVSSV